ncbi:MAG: hypothetical protein BWX88_03440 [Planctomycetes bacterium ADurb.Bin126]|nr:MAG: hypothetical protein BWX88_03440 [Planctomycetes bacterium ADurb.Bin126]
MPDPATHPLRLSKSASQKTTPYAREQGNEIYIPVAETDSQESQSRKPAPPPPPASVTILRHCRCIDCCNFYRQDGVCFCAAGIGGTLITWGTGERAYHPTTDAWHYCAGYDGPAISKSVFVWRSDNLAPRGDSHEPTGVGRETGAPGSGPGARPVPTSAREGAGASAAGSSGTAQGSDVDTDRAEGPTPSADAVDPSESRRVPRRHAADARRVAMHPPLFPSGSDGGPGGAISRRRPRAVAGRADGRQVRRLNGPQTAHVGPGSNISEGSEP